MPHPKVKLSDDSGNTVSVTDNKLDVNAVLSASDNIEIGNVDIKLNGTGVSADEGNADAGTIRVTLADDDPAVTDLAAIEVLLTSMVTDTDAIAAAAGIDGNSGPLGALSIGGTYSDGTLQEIAVDATGNLQVDVLTAPSTAVTNAGTFAVQSTHNITGMTHGINTDIDTTAEQLDGSTSGLDTACKRVDLMADFNNSGIIYVGGSDSIGPLTGGIVLRGGDFYSIDIDNLNQIWIEAGSNNQTIRYIYFT